MARVFCIALGLPALCACSGTPDGGSDAGPNVDIGRSTPDQGVIDDAGTMDLDAGPDTGPMIDLGPPVCGDGRVQGAEGCDDGAANSDSEPGACRSTCEPARCGDGVIDDGEECDTGPLRSDLIPDACRRDCRRPSCGDSIVDTDEVCDEGLQNSDTAADACRTSCVVAACGDGTIDDGEECDEGPDNSDTTPLACKTDCTLSSCGDGVIDGNRIGGEECDDGDENADVNDTCRTTCDLPRCGDGIVDHREQCDGQPNCNASCRWDLTGEAPVPITYAANGTPTEACVAATPALCTEFVDEGWAMFNTGRPGRERIGPAYPCWEYYTIACSDGRCPYWDERACLAPLELPTECQAVGDAICPVLTLSSCPSDFELTSCGSSAFRSQRPPLFDPACRDTVSSRCDSLARSMCPRDIDSCTAFDADGTAPAGCTWYLQSECPGVISAACPSVNITTCSDMPTALAGRPAVCTGWLAERCDGWEDGLCPDTVPGGFDVEDCTERYNILQINYPDVCHPWLENQCRGQVAEQAQTVHETSTGCPSETTRVSSGAYGTYQSTEDSVSEPDRHDCPIYAYEPAPPALVPYEESGLEGVIADAAVTLYRNSLNTAAVGSCSEYVAQTYHTYNLYRTYTREFYDDARRVFQLAYSDNADDVEVAIGYRALNLGTSTFDEYGGSFLPNWQDFGLGRPPLYPRNDFGEINMGVHGALRDSLRNIEQQRADRGGFPLAGEDARNDRILTAISANGFIHRRTPEIGPEDGWHFHERVSRSLGERGFSEDRMMHAWSLRDRFLGLLERRALLVEQLEAPRFISDLFGDPIGDALRSDIFSVDTTISALLEDADDLGCFSPQGYDANGVPLPRSCDWAPMDFVEDVQDAFELAIEAELERCESVAPADFSTLSSGYVYLPVGGTEFVTETTDPSSTTDLMRLYLDRQEYTYANLDDAFDTNDPVRRPTYGESYQSSDDVGIPSWFGAGYDASASWFVDFPDGPGGDPDLCLIEAGAETNLEAWVDLATIRFSVLDGGADTDLRTQHFATHLSVLGVDIWDETLSGREEVDAIDRDYAFNLVFDSDVASDTFSESVSAPVFSIAGFDVVVTIGAAGEMGLEVGGELRMALDTSGECGPGGHVAVAVGARPYASLSGFAQLGIDLFVVEIGVGASLQVLDVGLPVETSLRFQTDGPLRDTSFIVSADADLELEVLSGRVYVYADTWWKTYKKTLFRWNGPSWQVPLFHKAWSYALGPLVTYCDLNPAACQ